MVPAQTVGILVVDPVRVVAVAMVGSSLAQQSAESRRRRGPVVLSKQTGLAIQVAKAKLVRPGYPHFVPSCCSRVEEAGTVSGQQTLALVRYPCGFNVQYHVSLNKRQLTASDHQYSTYNRPKMNRINTSWKEIRRGQHLPVLASLKRIHTPADIHHPLFRVYRHTGPFPAQNTKEQDDGGCECRKL